MMTIREFGQIVARYQGALVITLDGDGVRLRSPRSGDLLLSWATLEQEEPSAVSQRFDWWARSAGG